MSESFLAVDENFRPRANSVPALNVTTFLHDKSRLPEITVEDETEKETDDKLSPFPSESMKSFLVSRVRANTCPEAFFRRSNSRPPTPPPGTIRKPIRRRSTSGYTTTGQKEPISFVHHHLTRLNETEGDVNQSEYASFRPGNTKANIRAMSTSYEQQSTSTSTCGAQTLTEEPDDTF